jgi:hypothetical protein
MLLLLLPLLLQLLLLLLFIIGIQYEADDIRNNGYKKYIDNNSV